MLCKRGGPGREVLRLRIKYLMSNSLLLIGVPIVMTSGWSALLKRNLVQCIVAIYLLSALRRVSPYLLNLFGGGKNLVVETHGCCPLCVFYICS